MGDSASFCDYINAHRTAGLVITGDATETGGNFHAILDGHIAAQLVELDPAAPAQEKSLEIRDAGLAQWGEHRANLALKPTPEWTRWLNLNGKLQPQEAFAIFLEENAADVIIPPDGVRTVAGFPVPPSDQLPNSAELISVALTLATKTNVEFSSKINRSNGQTQLTYIEKLTGTHAGASEGKMGIPEFFCLAIAPFRGCAPQVVLCRLRFRASGGKAAFEYQMIRPHKIVEHAWKMIAVNITASTGETVLLGDVTIPTRKTA